MLSVLVFRISGYLYLRGKGRAARRNGARGMRSGYSHSREHVSTFETRNQ